MKDENVDAALEGLVKVLKRKRSESEKGDGDESNKKAKIIEEGEMIISDDDETYIEKTSVQC
ncbi:unnamed protein product [Arabis nemorensis]|uniref:Uncharacterized protein n=1 Tax=Arabis nemorensis TaxID=586526 RepID=A0A565BF93_9BRAS|nr:unnamed protein product [Arabis nemorensis]